MRSVQAQELTIAHRLKGARKLASVEIERSCGRYLIRAGIEPELVGASPDHCGVHGVHVHRLTFKRVQRPSSNHSAVGLSFADRSIGGCETSVVALRPSDSTMNVARNARRANAQRRCLCDRHQPRNARWSLKKRRRKRRRQQKTTQKTTQQASPWRCFADGRGLLLAS